MTTDLIQEARNFSERQIANVDAMERQVLSLVGGVLRRATIRARGSRGKVFVQWDQLRVDGSLDPIAHLVSLKVSIPVTVAQERTSHDTTD